MKYKLRYKSVLAVLFAIMWLFIISCKFSFGITAEAATYIDCGEENFDAVYNMAEAAENITISSSGTYYITGTSKSYNINVTAESENDNITLVLDEVSVTSSTKSPLSLSGEGTITVVLIGENTLKNSGTKEATGKPGICKGTSGRLIIEADENDSTAALTASGGYYSAGIGSVYGEDAAYIYINSGNITAAGSSGGAGIGSAYKSAASFIYINGGTVSARGSTATVSSVDYGGAGIGSGGVGAAENIYINGGTISATGGSGGAGIGSGYTGKVSGIYISEDSGAETEITAAGGSNGAGIGSGGNSSSASKCAAGIYISGGTIEAEGGSSGAGIGTGRYSDGSGIYISGGTITASGRSYAAGIGGGHHGDYSDIVISGGTIEAEGGSNGGAGIGGGCYGNVSDITISGGIIYAVCSGHGGAGVGGGIYGSAESITISGGTVTAAGGTLSASSNYYGAGVGSGYNGATYVNEIIIGKASVKASSISVSPINENKERVYLYVIPDTAEGDTVYIDGDEFITSVVHHTDDDTDNNQYLYLTDSVVNAAVLYDTDIAKNYSLSCSDGEGSVVYENDVILLKVQDEIIFLDMDYNFDDSGIVVETDENNNISGITIDTAVYGGENAKYIDNAGISVDGRLYSLNNYFYKDSSRRYAYFPVAAESPLTSKRARGVAGVREGGKDSEEITYFVSEGEDGLNIASAGAE